MAAKKFVPSVRLKTKYKFGTKKYGEAGNWADALHPKNRKTTVRRKGK